MTLVPSIRATITLFTVTCCVAGLARAADLRSLEIEHADGRYEFLSETYLEAPAAEIYAVLVDYDDNRFGRISSIYKESRYLEPLPDGTPLIFTRVEGCLLFYCLSMKRVERLEAMPPEFISTIALPEQSDFRYSRSEWWLEPEATGTRVRYRLVMEPDFWVPPVVGPWFLKRRLSEGGKRALARIERIAREQGGLPPLSPEP